MRYRPDLVTEKVGSGARKLEYFLTKKLLFRDITGGGIIATIDSENYLTNDRLHSMYFVKDFDFEFILALVNSKLINFWIKSTFNNSPYTKINQLEKTIFKKAPSGEL
jgi:hypothetical protein